MEPVSHVINGPKSRGQVTPAASVIRFIVFKHGLKEIVL
jgi:hypothetical protein